MAKKPIAGVAVLCQDPSGNIIGNLYKDRQSNLRDRVYVEGTGGEHWGCMLTSVLRQYPFPETKGFIPEGYVWLEVAKHYDDWTANEPLRIYYAGEPDALSKTKLTRGMVLYARAMIRRDWKYARYQPLRFLRALMAAMVPMWLLSRRPRHHPL